MRNLITVLAFFLAITSSFAQTTPTLTKGETIAYLDKKIKEAVGHRLKNGNGDIGEIVNASVVKDDKGIKIEYNWKTATSTATSPFYWWVRYVFNPSTIKDAAPIENKTESAINEIGISLIGNTCVYSAGGTTFAGYYSQQSTASKQYANFLYVSADPENAAKIKKALLYLKSLMKAEDDPFAN